MLTANRRATHTLSPLHFDSIKRAHLRRGGLHVVPASAEVVFELAQRRDAQFLFEVGVLLLFGRQNLLQRTDLLFQLDVHNKKTKDKKSCLTVFILSTLPVPSKRVLENVHSYFSEFLLDLLSLLLRHDGGI